MSTTRVREISLYQAVSTSRETSCLSCSGQTRETDTALYAQRAQFICSSVRRHFNHAWAVPIWLWEQTLLFQPREGSVCMQQCLKTFRFHFSCSDLTLRTDTTLYAKRAQFVCSSVWRHFRHTWAVPIWLWEQTLLSQPREGSVCMQQCLKTFPSYLSCSDLSQRTDKVF